MLVDGALACAGELSEQPSVTAGSHDDGSEGEFSGGSPNQVAGAPRYRSKANRVLDEPLP